MNITEKLRRLGYQYSPAARRATACGESDQSVREAMIYEWQVFNESQLNEIKQAIAQRDIDPDGVSGEATEISLSANRCGWPDYLPEDWNERGRFLHSLNLIPEPDALAARWPDQCSLNLTWSHRVTGLKRLSRQDIDQSFLWAAENWTAAIEVGFEEKQSDYPRTNLYEHSHNLGSGGVLADHVLVYGNCGTSTRGRYNTLIDWPSREYFATVCTHEWGHALGLPHVSDKNALMYPSINQASVGRRGRPSESDIREAIRQGYRRRQGDPPPPDNPETPEGGGKYAYSYIAGGLLFQHAGEVRVSKRP